MNEKFSIHTHNGFTLTAKRKITLTGKEVEHDARVIFKILVSKLSGHCTNRVLELYNLWDKYSDDEDTPVGEFGADEFLKNLDRGKVKDYGDSN